MADEPLRFLLRRLRHVTDPGGDTAPSDAQLLDRFVAVRDQAAFELLVWRHGTMVLSLCRRLLRHEQDAEDAFQATFLVLARKAASIGRREACASWLYKVAYRVALAARSVAAERAAREQPCPDEVPAAQATDDLVWRDLRPVLDEEVSRLPQKYRAAFVLCCLEGRTNAEAAEQLGCPEGTVLSRLSRARERLRQRLLRRGVCLSAGLLAAVVAANGQPAEVTAGLVGTTSKAALAVAAGQAVAAVATARAAALTEGVLRAMFMTKLKVALGIVLAVGLIGLGAGLIGGQLLAEPTKTASAPAPDEPKPPPPAEGAAAAPGKKAEPDDPTQAALRRLQSKRNLEKIGAALHAYADAMGALPPPAIYEGGPGGTPPGPGGGDNRPGPPRTGGPGEGRPGGIPSLGGPGGAGPGMPGRGPGGIGGPGAISDKTGKPLLSWRVAILPWLEQDNLYKQFKLDEPWDSAHNKKLLDQMPAVYAPPGPRDKDKYRTYYQAIVGQGAAWEPRGQMNWASFTDGTSNTILVVEAATPVPWTKPEDLPFVADQALPKFGGVFDGDFHALFADGRVHLISRRADEDQLRAAITAAGGEPVDFNKLLVAGVKGPGAKVDVAGLPRQNEQLRKAVDAALAEVAKEKEETELLKLKVAAGIPKIDAKTAQLLKENAELQKALDRALEELDKLRSERERLEKQLRTPAREERKP
jgi:RNA polymerase sigma factor (sigma-70 family)